MCDDNDCNVMKVTTKHPHEEGGEAGLARWESKAAGACALKPLTRAQPGHDNHDKYDLHDDDDDDHDDICAMKPLTHGQPLET